MASAGSPRRVLIIVENLPVPFDRRVWQEATTLQQAGYLVSIDKKENSYTVRRTFGTRRRVLHMRAADFGHDDGDDHGDDDAGGGDEEEVLDHPV